MPLSPPIVDDVPLLPVEEPIDEPLFELLLPEDDPLTLRAVRVWSSIWPEALRPFCFWNFFSAALVFGPSMPSTGPALKPWSFSACCTCDTLLSLLDDDEAEGEEDCDEEEDGEEDCDDEDDGEEDCDDDDGEEDCEVLIAGVWL